MPAKRKLSFEQNEAIHRNLGKAQAANRARHAGNRARDEERRQYELRNAEQAAEDKRRRNGFEPGDRVTGRERVFNRPFSGTVTDAKPDPQEGISVLCDDGETRWFGWYSTKPEEQS